MPRPGGAEGAWQRHRFLWLALLATVVTLALMGIVYAIEWVTQREVEQLFKRLDLIGVALACAGVLILVSGLLEGRVKSGTLTTRTAIVIGLVQAVCLPFRGFSRSGATISTALLCGVPRRLAEDFSFALAVLVTPAAIGHMAQRLFKDGEKLSWPAIGDLLLSGLVGMVFSFAAGYVALQLLSAALEGGRWKYFAFYCFVAGAVVITYYGVVHGW
jgi:undecaprenyl-diphosphatase